MNSISNQKARINPIVVLVLLAIVVGGLTRYYTNGDKVTNENNSSGPSSSNQVNPVQHKNVLAWDGSSGIPYPVTLYPLEEYDFKSKTEILALREKRVMEHQPLIKGPYEPLVSIFGAIEDGKAWWGVEGIIRYANGEKSIEGPSKESLFIGNPFLLIGLGETSALRTDMVFDSPTDTVFPSPWELVYEAKGPQARVVYNVSNYFNYCEKIKANFLPDHPINLKAYNAKDFGFHYLWVDENLSHHIRINQEATQATRIGQLIHCGGSCGYPGGCNNMSPFQENLVLHVDSLPALVTIKLFKEKPANTSEPSDFVFIMELK